MRQNTTLVREAKFINFSASLLLFTAGFILLFVPLTAASLGIKILVGVLFIVIGGAKMLGYFSNDLYRLAFQFDFAIGIFSGILGVLIFAGNQTAMEYLPIALGIYAILDGLLKLQTGMDAYRFGMHAWAAMIGTAILLCLIGVTTTVIACLDFAPSYYRQLIALPLMGSGAENAWITMYTVRVRARKRNLSARYGFGEANASRRRPPADHS